MERLTPDLTLSCHVMLDTYFPLFWKYLRNCVKLGVKQMPLLKLPPTNEKNKITGGRKGGCVSIRRPLFESGSRMSCANSRDVCNKIHSNKSETG